MFDTESLIQETDIYPRVYEPPKLSEWRCYLFGSEQTGISWIPSEGEVPNWFWRKMQYLCFGNRWVKNPEVDMSSPNQSSIHDQQI
jgi:hypothetical protein